jgi:cell division protein FtsZ
VVADAADPEANIIFGATIDPELSGQVWVTVVAANFSGVRAGPPADAPAREPAPARAERPSLSRRAERVTRFDLPYPAAAPSEGAAGGGAAPGVFDVEVEPPPELDPESTGVFRRPGARGDEPEDAA